MTPKPQTHQQFKADQPHHQFKAAMRVIANLVGDSSDEDVLHDVRAIGEDPDRLAQKITDLFEEVFSPLEGKRVFEPLERTGGHAQLLQRIQDSGLLPSARSFDVVWNCIVNALHGLDIDRVRLYLLSEDKEFLYAVAHWGMGDEFIFQRRVVRDEPYWDTLSSDCRLHVFCREPGRLAPFEEGVSEEMAVREWFCQLLTWNGKIVGKLSGDCKNSGRRLDPESLRPIELFAPLLGSAIGHARLLTNLGSVLKVSSAAMRCDTVAEIMQEACHGAQDIPGVDHTSLLIFNVDGSSGRIEAEYPKWGTQGSVIALQGVALAEHFTKTCEPLVISDVPSELGLGHFREMLAKLEIQSLLIVPVISSGRMVGALILDARKNIYRFTSADVALAGIYASQVGLAIEHQRLKDDSTALARLDQAVDDMLIAVDFRQLAQLVADRAKELFEASFAVFQSYKGNAVESNNEPVFSSGILPLEWIAIEQHEASRHRLAVTVRDRGWVEIANILDPNQTFPGLQLPPNIFCFQGIALKTQSETEGILFLGYSHPDAFTAEQRQRARKFAAFAALSLQRIRGISDTNRSITLPADERTKAHLSAFYEASRIITSATRGVAPAQTLDDILKQAIECTKIGKDTFRNTVGTIWIFDRTSNTLRLVNTYPRRGELDDRPIGYTYAILEGFGKIGVTGRAVICKTPQRVPNVQNDEDYIQLNPCTLSELAVPILEGDTLLGVLNLECDQEDAFDHFDEDLVTALAGLAAIAIQNSRERYMMSTALKL
jgi:GAF domain-containing protein